MPVTLTLPDLRKTLADLQRRIGILERRTTPRVEPDTSWELVFSYAGTLAAAESPPASVRRHSALDELAIALGTAGSTATEIDVKRDGTVVATVTVPSSTTTMVADIGENYVAEDLISLEITTAGTGAADMTATARFT